MSRKQEALLGGAYRLKILCNRNGIRLSQSMGYHFRGATTGTLLGLLKDLDLLNQIIGMLTGKPGKCAIAFAGIAMARAALNHAEVWNAFGENNFAAGNLWG